MVDGRLKPLLSLSFAEQYKGSKRKGGVGGVTIKTRVHGSCKREQNPDQTSPLPLTGGRLTLG